MQCVIVVVIIIVMMATFTCTLLLPHLVLLRASFRLIP